MNNFNRADVLRILHITPRQLSGWQRAGLVAVGETFSFYDLLQLKKVRDLREQKVRPAVIRESLRAMQAAVSGMENPFVEASSFQMGSRVAFRHDGRALEPIKGQFVMDFEDTGNVVLEERSVRAIASPQSAAEYFNRGVALEDDPGSQEDAIKAYHRVLEIAPDFAPAHINLGTLHYNSQDYVLAEFHYRKAIECDSRYALAYFDLGNVLDETGRIPEAILAYKTALQLAPTYADAHYNIALAYERTRETRRALAHWRAYSKLDVSGPWAIHARSQVKRILDGEKLRVVFRNKRA
jgi:tetratricopeptide (TPR) repeat protein